jgi:hypothetical protein
MSVGWVLMLRQDQTLAASAHKLVAEAEEAIRVGQQQEQPSEGWKLHRISRMPEVRTCLLLVTAPPRAGVMRGQAALSSLAPTRWRSQASGGQGSEIADLIRCLSGAQANDSGWPIFKGKYVEYPKFRRVVGLQKNVSWACTGYICIHIAMHDL